MVVVLVEQALAARAQVAAPGTTGTTVEEARQGTAEAAPTVTADTIDTGALVAAPGAVPDVSAVSCIIAQHTPLHCGVLLPLLSSRHPTKPAVH